MLWTPDLSLQLGPYSVLLAKDELIDEARFEEDGQPRRVPIKIYYPDAADKDETFPVIFWSHGFGGSRDGAAFLARYLASYGYILVHMTHFGTDSSLWEGQPGHPWDILRKVKVRRQTTIKRFKDVPFVLDQLKNGVLNKSEINKLANYNLLGISGHSFGSMTTQVIAGQRFPDRDQVLRDFSDLRFKAGILYSPVPISHITDAPPDEIYKPISIPLLHMTGTHDSSPLEGFDYEQRLTVFNHAGHDEQYLLIKEKGDHMVYNGTRGKLAANPLRERHEEIIKITSLAYWDAELKNEKKAKDWLTNGSLQTYLGQDALFRTE